MSDQRIQNQIAIYMTTKKLVEFNDKLKPAPMEYYAHLHAEGEQLPDGRRNRSCIGIVLQDYSKGKGASTVRVQANLAPGFFQYALSRVSIGVENFEFIEDKIFGEPDADGLCQVTKVTIKRASRSADGTPRNYPWYICVENGKGIKEKNANGGFFMQKGSYKMERTAFININDYDFFQLMQRCVRYIEVWELTTGPKTVRDGLKAKDEQAAQVAQEMKEAG